MIVKIVALVVVVLALVAYYRVGCRQGWR